jgi:hypothetical protein
MMALNKKKKHCCRIFLTHLMILSLVNFSNPLITFDMLIFLGEKIGARVHVFEVLPRSFESAKATGAIRTEFQGGAPRLAFLSLSFPLTGRISLSPRRKSNSW